MKINTEELRDDAEWKKLLMWTKGLYIAACTVAKIAWPGFPRLRSTTFVFTVDELRKYTGRPAKLVLQHLLILHRAGFIEPRADGCWRIVPTRVVARRRRGLR